MTTVFTRAREAWEACADIRTMRRRLKGYTYGRQWVDKCIDRNGMTTTDEEYARRCGRRPVTNNLIRSLVKSVVGRFRQSLIAGRDSDPDSPVSRLTRANRLEELDARALEEFLISGCAIQKVSYERRFEGAQVWVDNVNPDRFFCNRYLDPRGSDIRLIGMLHEMSLAEMKMRFGHSSRRRVRDISQIYSRAVASRPDIARVAASLGTGGSEVSFATSSDPQLCRVVEVWTFDSDSRTGGAWHGRYFAPDGTLIDETVSPYVHGSHPFVVNLYPLTDGEVHPFIEDVVDQQKHINQLISVIDQILAHSAKGALLFPHDALMPGISLENVIDFWSRPGAVIPVNPKASHMPVEITAPGHSEGASRLLDIEMKMFQQISGVSTALQGQNIGGNMSASLYESQVQNSAIALLDIFETFNSFRAARDEKAFATVD